MITIIDYNAGNIASVKRALDYLKIDNVVSANPDAVLHAEKLIFPGVGHAAAAMEELNRSGLGDALKKAYAGGTPILGICIGCQIILTRSEEGNTPCLDLVSGVVKRFDLDTTQYKVPHMGWNEVRLVRPFPMLEDCGGEFYFVHAYYVLPDDKNTVVAVCDHGGEFPAVIAQKNLVAVQFHPEKSGPGGLRVLQNFNGWEGE